VVLLVGRRLLYFFDTNLKPTVSRDAEEKRDRFFFFFGGFTISLLCAARGEGEEEEEEDPFSVRDREKGVRSFDRDEEE